MKHISKQPEPASLREKRNTPGSSYEGPQAEWQEQLLQEQGHLCAYCMKRISLDRKDGKPQMEIEHILPREHSPENSLVWTNMVAVCNGKSGKEAHCDKTPPPNGKMDGKVTLEMLNPLRKDMSEALVAYGTGGEIKSINGNVTVNNELNKKLNLNAQVLKEARKEVINIAHKQLEKNYPDKKWNQRIFEKEIAEWSAKTNDKYKAYCQAAIWYLEWLRQKPIYRQ